MGGSDGGRLTGVPTTARALGPESLSLFDRFLAKTAAEEDGTATEEDGKG